MAVVASYYTGSWKLFILLSLLGYLFVSQTSRIRRSMRAGAALAQAELQAAQRECERRLREQKAKAAKEFTKKLVHNLKAMKKEGGKPEKMEMGEPLKAGKKA